jgi:hypothetical protein
MKLDQQLIDYSISLGAIRHPVYYLCLWLRPFAMITFAILGCIAVSTDVLGKNAWKECFKVSDVVLPTGYFFGMSAATGDLSDNHDVISIKAYEIDMGAVPDEVSWSFLCFSSKS